VISAPNADRFIELLGASEVHSLDISAYEGADIIHDLNEPLPGSLASKYNKL
jgi:hypothetical protein